MIMKKQFEKWRQFLVESKGKKFHDEYEAHLYLAILQSKEIDRTEIMASMRAIPSVTTVYREEEISTSSEVFVGEYIIRFVLPLKSSAKHYYDTVLKRELEKIKGLTIRRDLGYEDIGRE